MEKIKILFGFQDENFEKAIKGLLKQHEYDAEIFARFNKESVKGFIDKNPDTAAVVLLEAFPKHDRGAKSQKYTAEELAQLTEGSDVNVIVVLSENYKGTDYLRTLFAAGITSAFLQKRGSGATPKDIATLILRKRTRKMAREYYGIGNGKIDVGYIERDDFNELYQKMHSKDNLLAGYLTICANLNATQIADFTKRLPEDDITYLAGFEEFHTVMELLKKFGMDLKIKKPKKVAIGLNKTVAISMVNDRVIIGDEPAEKEEVREAEVEEEVEEKPIKEETVSEEEPAAVVEEPVEEVTESVVEEEKKENGPNYDEMDFDTLLAIAMGGEIPQKAPASESKTEPVVEEVKAVAEEKEEPEVEPPIVEETKTEPEPDAVEEPQVEKAECIKEEIKEEVKEEPKAEPEKESKKAPKEKPKKTPKEKPKKAPKETIKEAVKKVERNLEEEEELPPIEFDDEEYEDIILNGKKKGKSPVYILIMLLFIAGILAMYYFTK